MATAAVDGSLPLYHHSQTTKPHSHSRSLSQMSAAEVLRTPVSSNGSAGLPEGDGDDGVVVVDINGRRSGSFEKQRRWSKGSKGTGVSAKGVLSVLTIEQSSHREQQQQQQAAHGHHPYQQVKRASGTGTFGDGSASVRSHPLQQQDVVLDIGHAMMEGKGGNTTIVLPPSPPLTQAGSEESLRERAKRDMLVNGQEDDIGTADVSTWAVKSYRLDDDEDVNNEVGSGRADGTADLSLRENDGEGPSSSTGAASGTASRSLAHSQSISQFSRQDSQRSKTGALKPKSSMSTLPSPTRSHPLYRPPSPQPWDLVEPPSGSNGAAGSRTKDRNSRRPISGLFNFGGREDALDSMDEGDGVQSSWKVKRASRQQAKAAASGSGGYKIPHSNYYYGPPPPNSAFGSDPTGQIGVHHPREIVRIERDYSGGELVQFSPAYPLELEGRITPTQFLETINIINETLISAHNLRWAFLDNSIAVLSLYLSRLFLRSHYDKEMLRLQKIVADLNTQLYNPVGLHVLWPKTSAFLFLEIEYY